MVSERVERLGVPPLTAGYAVPGRRVRQVLDEYRGAGVYHSLYLPVDWGSGDLYPVIVEYPGNRWHDAASGASCSGNVDDCCLGYGQSGGHGFIWLALPFINSVQRCNQLTWWGDIEATVRYCLEAVRQVCDEYGGDPARVFLTGFSRGAIACSYVGLHNDEIADMWLGFMPHSHYDGSSPTWPGKETEEEVRQRLARLKGRASFVTHEREIPPGVLRVVEDAPGQFVLVPIPGIGHSDRWVLDDRPERRALRTWMAQVMETMPGLHRLTGRVLDGSGAGVACVRIESGANHWTYTERSGRYILPGLLDGERSVTPRREGYRFEPPDLHVTMAGQDVNGLDFRAK